MPRMVRGATAPQRRVLGIDASLTSTGYSYRLNGRLYTGTIKSKLFGIARLFDIKQQLQRIVTLANPDLVVFEDYAKGKGGMGRTFDIGELGGVLKTYLYECGIDVMLASPSAMKKAITGKGNADAGKTVPGRKTKLKDKTKPEMRAALLNTFGVELRQGDEADACGLMLMGEMRFGSHTVARSVQATLRLDALRECVIIQGHQPQLKLIAK